MRTNNFVANLTGWLAKKTFVVENKQHSFALLMQSKKCLRVSKCPKCGHKLGIVGKSIQDAAVYICCCPKCHKISITRKTAQQATRCAGIKKDGSRCTYRPIPGSKYCKMHTSK